MTSIKSTGEALLMHQISLCSLPEPEREHRFDEVRGKQQKRREWRFDFAYPEKKIAIEVEGGVFVKSRHTTGKGFTKDCEKYNKAVELGWSVYRYTTQQVKSGEAIAQLSRILVGENA